MNDLVAEAELAKSYGRAATSARSRIEYARDWAHFLAYCGARHLRALPAAPQTVALYATTLASSLRVATIRRRMVAIAREHDLHGFEPPTRQVAVRAILRDIAETHGAPRRQMTALTDDLLRAILPPATGPLRELRDRALLLLGFAAALRRSELAALRVEDCFFTADGLTLTIHQTKTGSRRVGVPALANALCAVQAVQRWLGAAHLSRGPLFCSFALPAGRRGSPPLQHRPISGRDVARIVQRYTAALEGTFGGHSLRAGFVTSAAQKKVPESDIMRVTGHRSVAVVREYVRKATIFHDAPLRSILADSGETNGTTS